MMVLVTGGAGFIGSELVGQLAAAGRRVMVLDNLATGRRENLSGTAATLVEGDVSDRAVLDSILPGVDTVYHLACVSLRRSLREPRVGHDVNATGTLILLEACRAAGVRRYVHVSSSEVYGEAETVPMTEEHRTQPTTAYGASKLAGESYARAFHRTYGFPAVMVRPFNAFGPRCHHEGDSGEVIPKFLLLALAGRPMVIYGDGTQTRDFTHVSDIARGIRLAGKCDEAIGETINLGSGKEISMLGLAEEVARIAGRPRAEVIHEAARPGDVRRMCAGAGVARKLLGFEPSVGLRAGLMGLKEWYE
ncbi:MAG: GDP-mannose 4,6-dehydratase [Candidatus Solibacter usitatus]|nr:GDP-mannose 4,6-dehydratase [Candidatus Solibacter usitatus]